MIEDKMLHDAIEIIWTLIQWLEDEHMGMGGLAREFMDENYSKFYNDVFYE